jgi:hypothetical protein
MRYSSSVTPGKHRAMTTSGRLSLPLPGRSCEVTSVPNEIPRLAITSETQRVIPAAGLSLAEGKVVAVRKEEVIR